MRGCIFHMHQGSWRITRVETLEDGVRVTLRAGRKTRVRVLSAAHSHFIRHSADMSVWTLMRDVHIGTGDDGQPYHWTAEAFDVGNTSCAVMSRLHNALDQQLRGAPLRIVPQPKAA